MRLMLFSDRLECWNPGGIHGGQSVEDLDLVSVQPPATPPQP